MDCLQLVVTGFSLYCSGSRILKPPCGPWGRTGTQNRNRHSSQQRKEAEKSTSIRHQRTCPARCGWSLSKRQTLPSLVAWILPDPLQSWSEAFLSYVLFIRIRKLYMDARSTACQRDCVRTLAYQTSNQVYQGWHPTRWAPCMRSQSLPGPKQQARGRETPFRDGTLGVMKTVITGVSSGSGRNSLTQPSTKAQMAA